MDFVDWLYHKITSSQSACLLAPCFFIRVFRGNVFVKYSSVSLLFCVCLHFSSCANNGRTDYRSLSGRNRKCVFLSQSVAWSCTSSAAAATSQSPQFRGAVCPLLCATLCLTLSPFFSLCLHAPFAAGTPVVGGNDDDEIVQSMQGYRWSSNSNSNSNNSPLLCGGYNSLPPFLPLMLGLLDAVG